MKCTSQIQPKEIAHKKWKKKSVRIGSKNLGGRFPSISYGDSEIKGVIFERDWGSEIKDNTKRK